MDLQYTSITRTQLSVLYYVQARILYDFEGDTENGELIINEGEEVIVLNQVSHFVLPDYVSI